ncbi:hypothetical protein TSTA_049330 [Talaromyces stipitatus ATCC 10500]|uniref:Uncharacterized protein n=1 Tax=Talaromyces stipitatus (strain ATCC 10500 / CBS 375.48 / QM 6759 / NRRL 1006) TaxID=441959 RepID=B8MLG3_TALSN|nr:uncharacterized protein TSTA_049330 [Talaromyces stipitatus ATCC 10500]EED15496.1 hypothetical protein TSTA_049330 [Talaromyces stipitatus ATCC 10500]
MSQMEDETISSTQFSAWIQEADISETLASTVQILSGISVTRFSDGSLKMLDNSAPGLWNAFMRFLRRIEGGRGDVGSEIVKVPLLVCRMLECCYSEEGGGKFGMRLLDC